MKAYPATEAEERRQERAQALGLCPACLQAVARSYSVQRPGDPLVYVFCELCRDRAWLNERLEECWPSTLALRPPPCPRCGATSVDEVWVITCKCDQCAGRSIACCAHCWSDEERQAIDRRVRVEGRR